MAPQLAGRVINAWPTKDFFIDMLVKDIQLGPAIVDLVDNAVDGARRLRGSEDYEGLSVRVEAKPDGFRISDNCGGIPVDLARDYAFRFGRPEGMPKVAHSVGQFGVGMKRALFKLGKRFNIESTTETSRFAMEVDVEEWRRKDEWEFEFKVLEENLSRVSIDDQGTTIIVESLHDAVASKFKLENFQTALHALLADEHRENLEKGLAISLNGIPLEALPMELLQSENIKSAHRVLRVGFADREQVAVKIYAGIHDSDPERAGWYIFCNGRLVLGADQTIVTGWGEGEGRGIPKYHNQFARFRGFVFLDSDDAGLLPWNTTKTGVDQDSALFQAVRLEMTQVMRPVITFLNKLDAEKESAKTDDGPLDAALKAAVLVGLLSIAVADTFLALKAKPAKRPPRSGRIQYDRPLDQINKVKRRLKVTTYREVGERTFEYFFDLECAE